MFNSRKEPVDTIRTPGRRGTTTINPARASMAHKFRAESNFVDFSAGLRAPVDLTAACGSPGCTFKQIEIEERK